MAGFQVSTEGPPVRGKVLLAVQNRREHGGFIYWGD
jgi:hypothetical protein